MVYFDDKKQNGDDMSMEDILASIRKYVSEEDMKNVSSENQSSKNDSNDDSLEVITLGESQISDNDHEDYMEPETSRNTPHEENYGTSQTYTEESTLSQSVRSDPNTNQAESPFNRLASAMRSYGKQQKESSKDNGNNPGNMLTVDQFLTVLATPIIEKWVEKNMKKLVDEAINKEIAKLKSM